jgi:hypothetical protein
MPANQHTLLGAISHANRKHKVGRGGREKGLTKTVLSVQYTLCVGHRTQLGRRSSISVALPADCNKSGFRNVLRTCSRVYIHQLGACVSL